MIKRRQASLGRLRLEIVRVAYPGRICLLEYWAGDRIGVEEEEQQQEALSRRSLNTEQTENIYRGFTAWGESGEHNTKHEPNTSAPILTALLTSNFSFYDNKQILIIFQTSVIRPLTTGHWPHVMSHARAAFAVRHGGQRCLCADRREPRLAGFCFTEPGLPESISCASVADSEPY